MQLGFEIYHQTPGEKDAKASTGIDLGVTDDLNENFHLIASVGTGIRNTDEANRTTSYSGLLFILPRIRICDSSAGFPLDCVQPAACCLLPAACCLLPAACSLQPAAASICQPARRE